MTDTLTLTEDGFQLACQCGEIETIPLDALDGVELQDLLQTAEDYLEEIHNWGEHGHCPDCQAPLNRDMAEAENADNQRKTELA